MAYFLFVSGSGQDTGASPYEVISGVVVEDQNVRSLVHGAVETEVMHFGRRFHADGRPPEARNLLKKKVFRLAAQLPPMPQNERRTAACACLEAGDKASKVEITALAQAKLAYASDILDLCARCRCRFVGSITSKGARCPPHWQLRKDYAYFFERFFNVLEDQEPTPVGIVVCGERASVQRRRLAAQMEHYFRGTARWRQRASLVGGEPLLVTGKMCSAIGVASLVAYVTSWAFRTKDLHQPVRHELTNLREQVRAMRHWVTRELGGNPNFVIWGFAVVTDVVMREDRDDFET